MGYSGFADLFQLRDALKWWNLCRPPVEHHTLMSHLPMLVFMQYMQRYATFWQHFVDMLPLATCTAVEVMLDVQSHLIIGFKLMSPFSFQLIRLPPFLRLDPPVKLRRRC
jgi:hypothetical protein